MLLAVIIRIHTSYLVFTTLNFLDSTKISPAVFQTARAFVTRQVTLLGNLTSNLTINLFRYRKL